jgi:hypothetical protein
MDNSYNSDNSDSMHKKPKNRLEAMSDSSDFFSARGKHKVKDQDFDWKHEALVYRELALGLIEVFRKSGQMIVLPKERHKRLVGLNVPGCTEVNLVSQPDDRDSVAVREPVCCCCPCWLTPKRMHKNRNLMYISYMRCKNEKGEWGLADSLNPGLRDWFFQLGISPDIVRIMPEDRVMERKGGNRNRRRER